MRAANTKAIEQLLQSAPAVEGRAALERSVVASARGTRVTAGKEASRSAPWAAARTVVKTEASPHQASDAAYESETPIILILEDDDEDDVMLVPSAATAPSVSATTTTSSDLEPVPTSAAAADDSVALEPEFEPSSSADWKLPMESQIYLIPESPPISEPLSPSPASAGAATPTRVSGTPIRKPYGTNSPSTPLHRRKTPRAIPLNLDLSGAVPARDDERLHQPAGNASDQEPGRSDGVERDDDAHFWTGGSRYEVNNEPWKIQSWFIRGLKQKLLQQHQQ